MSTTDIPISFAILPYLLYIVERNGTVKTNQLDFVLGFIENHVCSELMLFETVTICEQPKGVIDDIDVAITLATSQNEYGMDESYVVAYHIVNLGGIAELHVYSGFLDNSLDISNVRNHRKLEEEHHSITLFSLYDFIMTDIKIKEAFAFCKGASLRIDEMSTQLLKCC